MPHYMMFKRKTNDISCLIIVGPLITVVPVSHTIIDSRKSIMASASTSATIPVEERDEPKPSTQQQHRQASMSMHNATCISQQFIKFFFN